jgi:hypothetical protein
MEGQHVLPQSGLYCEYVRRVKIFQKIFAYVFKKELRTCPKTEYVHRVSLRNKNVAFIQEDEIARASIWDVIYIKVRNIKPN